MSNKNIEWVTDNLLAKNVFSRGVTCYLFGSITGRGTALSDIDLLIIYEDMDAIISIRDDLAPFCLERPIHLIFMTEAEALETNFIELVRCVKIFPENEIQYY